MPDNFGIQNNKIMHAVASTFESSTSQAENVPTSAAVVDVSSTSPETAPAINIEDVKKHQSAVNQQLIDKAINSVINGTGLTLEETKKMISSLSQKDSSSDMDMNKLTQVLNCLKYAIEDCTINGKLDIEKLEKIFGCYVFMTLQSDKKKVSCEEARKNMKMSLIQFIKTNNPNLKDKKNITALDVKEALKIFVLKNFTKEKLEQMKNVPQEAKNSIKSLIGMRLENCSSDEKKLLFEAFVLLLKDADMVEYTPILVDEVCNSLKDNPSKLQDFLTNHLRSILEKLGFKSQTINKLIQLGLIDNLNVDNVDELLNCGIKFLQNIETDKLSLLLEALNVYMSGGTLTTEQMKVLVDYRDQINMLIGVVAGIANKPELIKGNEELFEKLQNLLETSGLDDYVYKNLQSLYEEYTDMFTNISSKDELIKILNKLTHNEYGETIGDTNPDNLYKENNIEGDKSGIGFATNGSLDDFCLSLAKQNDLYQIIFDTDKSAEPAYLVLRNPKENKTETVTIPWQKYQSVKNLTAKDLYEGLVNNYIKIDDLLDNYKDLTQSAKLFVNKLIEIMSPAEQNFRLDGMPNRETIAIIKHSHINPEDLNLALDYASQKELDEMKAEKESA